MTPRVQGAFLDTLLGPADALVARELRLFAKRGDAFRARCMGVHGERQCRRVAVTKDGQGCARCTPAVDGSCCSCSARSLCAGGKIILPHASQPAFEMLRLAGNTSGGMVAEMLVNDLLGLLGNVAGDAREGVTGVPRQDHAIGRVRHESVPRGCPRPDRLVADTPA